MAENEVVAAPPAPVATPTPATVQIPSDQLAARFAEEREKAANAARQKFLEELGFGNADDVKTFVKAAKERAQAEMSEADRLKARLAELEASAPKLNAYQEALTAHAKNELAKLNDTQRAAVLALGGEDPAAQLKAIAALHPTWTVATPAVAPAPAAPITTAPSAPAPAPAAPGVPNHMATWESLKKTNPVEAARYFLTHRAAISDARKATPTT